MRPWVAALLAVVLANLCFVPGSQFLIGHVVRQWNPLAALAHVQALSNGGHAAFILTAAVNLRLFEALERQDDAATPSGIDLAWQYVMDPWGPKLAVACHSSRSVSVAAQIAVGDAAALLDALASFGLVSVCWTSENGRATYRNTLGARELLVGDDSLGRMATVSNHPAVVAAMANLAGTLRRATTSANDFTVDMGDLWQLYAANSVGFTRNVAEKAAERLAQGATPRTAVIEVGAGSAVFGIEFRRRVEQGIAVAVDLPEVTARLEAITPVLRTVAGSVFDSTTQQRCCTAVADAEGVMVLMASFAQHFAESDILRVAEALLACRPNSRLAFVELVRPDGPFNPFFEPVPFARSFHLALRSFTKHGAVRTLSDYETLAMRAMASSCETGSKPQVVSTGLFPMPATLVVGSCG